MHRHNERVRWRGVSESLVKQRELCRTLLEEHREALSETQEHLVKLHAAHSEKSEELEEINGELVTKATQLEDLKKAVEVLSENPSDAEDEPSGKLEQQLEVDELEHTAAAAAAGASEVETEVGAGANDESEPEVVPAQSGVASIPARVAHGRRGGPRAAVHRASSGSRAGGAAHGSGGAAHSGAGTGGGARRGDGVGADINLDNGLPATEAE
jgi:uncharacterized phage infection (PIP) family protein YhgE